MAALEDGGLQLGRLVRRIAVVTAGEGTADVQQVLGDGAVQLQGGVGVQIGGQGELQLLQLQFLGLDLLHGVQRIAAAVYRGHRLALAHPFALADLMAHGAAFTGEDLLVPDQPAADVDGVLGGALIDQRGGEGVRQGKIALCGEVQRNGRQQGDAEKAENTGVVHGSSLVECWDASLVRRQAGLLLQRDGVNGNDGGNSVLIDDLLLAVGVQHHGEAVKARHHAPQLKAVHQKDGQGNTLLAGLSEENFLKVVALLHIVCSFSLLADDVPSALGLIVSQER